MRQMSRSLRHRDYRRYFFGQLVSLHGTWMQNVAQAWLVYRLTNSSFMLGLVSFCALIPVLLFGMLGGAAADRLPRRTLFVSAQWLAMLQAVTLAILVFSGWVQVWQIMLLAFLLGCVHAFEMPARHALVADLVPREDIANAIGLNASTFNVARFIGPAIAGALIAMVGEGWLFLINAASFLAVIVALRTLQTPDRELPARQRGHVWEGLRYAWADRPIRLALVMVTGVSLVGAPYLVLMPVFAREIYGGGAETLGLLLGAAGAGALLGALRLAQRRMHGGLQRVIGIAAAAGGVAMVIFSFSGYLWFGLIMLIMIGFFFTSVVASSNAFMQMQVPDALRGRVMALFSVLFIGLAPLGNLLAGGVAEVIGAPLTVTLLGSVSVAGALLFLRYLQRETSG